MNENLKNFLKKLVKDEELLAKFQAAGTPDEAYELAAGIQDGFTREEFFEAMKKLNNIAKDQRDLSDEDLAAIASGANLDPLSHISHTTMSLSIFISAGWN